MRASSDCWTVCRARMMAGFFHGFFSAASRPINVTAFWKAWGA
jgi:hypothetical protein